MKKKIYRFLNAHYWVWRYGDYNNKVSLLSSSSSSPIAEDSKNYLSRRAKAKAENGFFVLLKCYANCDKTCIWMSMKLNCLKWFHLPLYFWSPETLYLKTHVRVKWQSMNVRRRRRRLFIQIMRNDASQRVVYGNVFSIEEAIERGRSHRKSPLNLHSLIPSEVETQQSIDDPFPFRWSFNSLIHYKEIEVFYRGERRGSATNYWSWRAWGI